MSPIRRLLPADAPAYRALMLDAYARHPDAFTSSAAERAPLPLAWWQARLSPAPDAAEQVFGAFVSDELAGAAGLAFNAHQKTRHKARFFGMAVWPRHRARGLGAAIVEAALQAARECAGVRLLQLTVSEGNDAALRLYGRHGFVAFGVEPMAVALGGRHVAKVHMSCDFCAGPAAAPQPASGGATSVPRQAGDPQ